MSDIITIVSSDKREFIVEKKIGEMSNTIKEMIKGKIK